MKHVVGVAGPIQTTIVIRRESVGPSFRFERAADGQWRWSSLREGWRVSEMAPGDELAGAQLPTATTTDTGGEP